MKRGKFSLELCLIYVIKIYKNLSKVHNSLCEFNKQTQIIIIINFSL